MHGYVPSKAPIAQRIMAAIRINRGSDLFVNFPEKKKENNAVSQYVIVSSSLVDPTDGQNPVYYNKNISVLICKSKLLVH